MLIPAVQLGAILLFLGVGMRYPRRDEGVLNGDTFLNVGVAVVLLVVKLLVLTKIAVVTGKGYLPLGALPAPLAFLLPFVLLDFLKYLLHYLDHRIPVLWLFHRTHHSSPRLNSTSGLRMHPVDYIKLAFLPVIVFSLVFDTTGVEWVVPASMLPGLVLDAFQHGNIRIDIQHPFWAAWDRLLNNPHFHAWHHTDEGHIWDGNYGNALTIWDRMFGTCVSRDELPKGFGVVGHEGLTNDMVGMILLRRPKAG